MEARKYMDILKHFESPIVRHTWELIIRPARVGKACMAFPEIRPFVAQAHEVLDSFPKDSREYLDAQVALDKIAAIPEAQNAEDVISDIKGIFDAYKREWETWVTVTDAAKEFLADDDGDLNGIYRWAKNPEACAKSRICQACDDGRLRFIGNGHDRRICPDSLHTLILKSRDRVSRQSE